MARQNRNVNVSTAELNAALKRWNSLPTRADLNAEAAYEFQAEREAENAWLRHAENAGWMETAAEERHDFERGVLY